MAAAMRLGDKTLDIGGEEEVASSREREHLARFGACGGESAPQGRVALPI